MSNAIIKIPDDSSFDEMQLLADKLNHFLHGRDLARVDEKFIMSFQKDVERDLSLYTYFCSYAGGSENAETGLF